MGADRRIEADSDVPVPIVAGEKYDAVSEDFGADRQGALVDIEMG